MCQERVPDTASNVSGNPDESGLTPLGNLSFVPGSPQANLCLLVTHCGTSADVERLSHKLEIEPELLEKYFRINIKTKCGGGLV